MQFFYQENMQRTRKTVVVPKRCPNLVEWDEWMILVCNANEKTYIPSFFELTEYCKNKYYCKCPFTHTHNAGKSKNEF